VYEVLAGVKVVEVASWLFAPGCGAVLADWGADVIKVETPKHGGDPYRGFFHVGGVNPLLELANRGKRSVALDISVPAGREALLRLVREADVFVTSLLPGPRSRLGIEVADLRAVNDSLIYVRASGYGPRGPDAETGGYDVVAAWARGGLADFLTPPDAAEPTPPPGGIGDIVGGFCGAGAVAAALFKRAQTGQPSEVDVSLLHGAMWIFSTVLQMHANGGAEQFSAGGRRAVPNPLVNCYRTQDGRWIWIALLQPDPLWPSFCEHIDRPELRDDPRFADFEARSKNRTALVDVLDEAFASRTVDEWRERLKSFEGVWDVSQTAREVIRDPQVLANGYLSAGKQPGPPLSVVTSPAQFDGQALGPVRRAPEHGQHTEEVLLECGYSWEQISELKSQGASI
jgi:crotonobetainyl-CoA:carnitine CoA-transferase CaiB-like acyl-CoA transferase